MPTRIKCPTYAIHSRKGAAQLTLYPAFASDKKFPTRNDGEIQVVEPGCLMIEAAPFLEKNSNGNMKFDWKNKVTMKLNCTDIQMMLAGLRGGECKIIHQNGSSQKSFLNLKKGAQFGYCLMLNRPPLSAMVNITTVEDENTLKVLLQRAIVRIMGW